jgi:hypothetical protein
VLPKPWKVHSLREIRKSPRSRIVSGAREHTPVLPYPVDVIDARGETASYVSKTMRRRSSS